MQEKIQSGVETKGTGEVTLTPSMTLIGLLLVAAAELYTENTCLFCPSTGLIVSDNIVRLGNQ
jgi:hypothetical protein